MAARIIHFGWDDCYRLAVLRRAGYHVIEAGCTAELIAELRGRRRFDAVIIAEDPEMNLPLVLDALRKVTPTPVVLFGRSPYHLGRKHFDLVIPSLVPPTEWLRQLALVIVRYRIVPCVAGFRYEPELAARSLPASQDAASSRAKPTRET